MQKEKATREDEAQEGDKIIIHYTGYHMEAEDVRLFAAVALLITGQLL